MYGENFPNTIKEMLSHVGMNPLEAGLLDKHLKDFDNVAENVTALMIKLTSKYTSRKAQEQIERVLNLFEKHDFWSTQPVQNCFDLVEANNFNRPVENK